MTTKTEGRRGLIEDLRKWAGYVLDEPDLSYGAWEALSDRLSEAARVIESALRSTPEAEGRADELRCARCCQSLPADIADREAFADPEVRCGPACCASDASDASDETAPTSPLIALAEELSARAERIECVPPFSNSYADALREAAQLARDYASRQPAEARVTKRKPGTRNPTQYRVEPAPPPSRERE